MQYYYPPIIVFTPNYFINMNITPPPPPIIVFTPNYFINMNIIIYFYDFHLMFIQLPIFLFVLLL